jgi:hypothetical protein
MLKLSDKKCDCGYYHYVGRVCPHSVEAANRRYEAQQATVEWLRTHPHWSFVLHVLFPVLVIIAILIVCFLIALKWPGLSLSARDALVYHEKV